MISTAIKRDAASGALVDRAIDVMTTLNAGARDAACCAPMIHPAMRPKITPATAKTTFSDFISVGRMGWMGRRGEVERDRDGSCPARLSCLSRRS